MKLEDLEKNLYKKVDSIGQKKKEPRISKPLEPANQPEIKTDWPSQAPAQEKESSGFFSKFSQMSHLTFWILIAVALIAVGLAAFYIYHYRGGNDIVFSLSAPSDALLAAPFDLEFEIKNVSPSDMQDVKLSMILPEAAGFVGENPEKRTLEKSLGIVKQNADVRDKIPLIVFSGSQQVEKFEVAISYFTPSLGSSVRFEQTKNASISIKEPALKLDLSAPQKVLNNEDFEIEVHYENISDTDFSNVELALAYPTFFTFKSASVNPSKGNNVWKIGDLIKNSGQKNFTIQGKVLSSEQSFFEIKGTLSAEVSGQKYLVNEKTASLNIASSPLSISIAANNQPNYLASLNSALNYKIFYQNSSDVGLNDVVITAKLVGDMFDFPTLLGNGFFDSKTNVITWNAGNTPSLKIISPGAEGSVEFQIQTKESYPIKRVSDKNFVLEVQAQISSPTVPYYVASDKTIGLADLKTKVSGKIMIVSQALSQGSLPLKVNAPTNFAIHWTITNYSTDVSGVEVSAFLQSGARWTGQVESNVSTSTLPTYNERTGEVRWLIDKISATKGVVSSPIEAVFQIEATPNVTQANQPMPLLSATNLTALDGFTNIQLTSQAKEISTQNVVMP